MGLKNKIDLFNTQVQSEGWRIDVDYNVNSMIFKNGFEYLNGNEDFLLALCLNNGYYKRENIYRMLNLLLIFLRECRYLLRMAPLNSTISRKGNQRRKHCAKPVWTEII